MDDEGFDALFFAHASRLVRLAGLLGAADPEDVVQEAFAKVYAARHRLDDQTRAVPYLNRVVVNEVRDRHRRSSVARRDAHLLVVRDQHLPAFDTGDRSAVLAELRALPPDSGRPWCCATGSTCRSPPSPTRWACARAP